MQDIVHWDNFPSPDSKPQMHTFDSLQTHDNTQQQTQIKHGNNYKKVPQHEIFMVHPGLHPVLSESLPRLLPKLTPIHFQQNKLTIFSILITILSYAQHPNCCCIRDPVPHANSLTGSKTCHRVFLHLW